MFVFKIHDVRVKIFPPKFIKSFTSTILDLFYPQRRGKVDTDADFSSSVKGDPTSVILSCW